MTDELCARVMAEIIEPTVRAMAQAGTPVQGRALRRADDRGRRTQAHRIQCPLRRSRGPGADAAAQLRSAAALLATAEGGFTASSSMERRCRALRGHGGQGLSGAYAKGSEIKGLERPRATRTCRSSTPAPSATEPRPRRWRPRARCHRAGPRHSRGAGAAPMRRSTRSTGRAASAAATSAGAPSSGYPDFCHARESGHRVLTVLVR